MRTMNRPADPINDSIDRRLRERGIDATVAIKDGRLRIDVRDERDHR